VFYGTEKKESADELRKCGVVLTTYSVVENAFRRQQYGFTRKGEKVFEPSLLHQVSWFRVILDEAHNIKDRSCSTARAVFALTAQYKWSLTGTPLQNRIGELYSLVRFLNVDPYSYYFCRQCECKSLSWKFHKNGNCMSCSHKGMRWVHNPLFCAHINSYDIFIFIYFILILFIQQSLLLVERRDSEAYSKGWQSGRGKGGVLESGNAVEADYAEEDKAGARQ